MKFEDDDLKDGKLWAALQKEIDRDLAEKESGETFQEELADIEDSIEFESKETKSEDHIPDETANLSNLRSVLEATERAKDEEAKQKMKQKMKQTKVEPVTQDIEIPEFTEEEEEIEETPAETPKKVSRVSQTTEKLEGLVDFDDDPAETKTESEPEEVMVDDDLIINEDDFDLDDETIEVAGKDKLTRQMVEELFAIREMAEDMEDDGDVDFEGNPADRKYYVHFNSAPTEILGEDGKVKAIRVERTETGADGKMHRTGEFTDYPVEAVYHAIGYKPAEAPGITYDEHGAHLANANGDGRITTEADGGKVRDRLYATGWAKRGPVGLIGSTKSDALAIVTNMLEDLAKAAEGGRVAADRDPESIDRLLAERGIRPIDFAGWKKVDAFERAEGAKEGREHKKVIEPDQMRELAHA